MQPPRSCFPLLGETVDGRDGYSVLQLPELTVPITLFVCEASRPIPIVTMAKDLTCAVAWPERREAGGLSGVS